MLKKSKIFSVDSIREDDFPEVEEGTQTSAEIYIVKVKGKKVAGVFWAKGCNIPSEEKDHSKSVTSFDTDASRKYPITLGEARNRALRRIKMAKKQRLSFEEEE